VDERTNAVACLWETPSLPPNPDLSGEPPKGSPCSSIPPPKQSAPKGTTTSHRRGLSFFHSNSRQTSGGSISVTSMSDDWVEMEYWRYCVWQDTLAIAVWLVILSVSTVIALSVASIDAHIAAMAFVVMACLFPGVWLSAEHLQYRRSPKALRCDGGSVFVKWRFDRGQLSEIPYSLIRNAEIIAKKGGGLIFLLSDEQAVRVPSGLDYHNLFVQRMLHLWGRRLEKEGKMLEVNSRRSAGELVYMASPLLVQASRNGRER